MVWSFVGGASCLCSEAAALCRAAKWPKTLAPGERNDPRVSGLLQKAMCKELPPKPAGERAPPAGGEEKSHRCRRELVLPKTRGYWNCADLPIQKLPFQRLVREIAQDFKGRGFRAPPLVRLRRLVKGTRQVCMKIRICSC